MSKWSIDGWEKFTIFDKVLFFLEIMIAVIGLISFVIQLTGMAETYNIFMPMFICFCLINARLDYVRKNAFNKDLACAGIMAVGYIIGLFL